jgi:Recombination endonuclease VII
VESPGAMKRCPDCGELKEVAEFGLNKRMPDGLARYCKVCFRRRSTQSYRKRMAEQGKAVREAVPVPEGFKYCPQCKEVKPVAEFGSNRAKKSGLTAYCKPCHTIVTRENKIKKFGSERNYLLQYRYGITEDDFERMLARQGGLCAICQVVPGTFVDHCHRTGDVRGVLCFNCNNGLGHFGDNTVLLELAALYLGGDVLWPELVVLPEARGGAPVAPSRTYHLSQRYRMRHEDVGSAWFVCGVLGSAARACGSLSSDRWCAVRVVLAV